MKIIWQYLKPFKSWLYLALFLSAIGQILQLTDPVIFGIIIDMFYDSLGLHAFACVLVMYFRNYWLSLLTPQGGYDSTASPSLAMSGVQWFLVYTFPLVFLHHAFLFFIEVGGFGMFWFTLGKVFVSAIFTTIAIVLVEFLFPGRRLR